MEGKPRSEPYMPSSAKAQARGLETEQVEKADIHLTAEDHVSKIEGAQEWDLKSILAFISLGIAFIGPQLSLFFLASTLSYITAEINPEGKASWIPISYTLAAAVPVPFAGYIQDIIGRRYMTISASVICIIGAAIIGTAHSFPHILSGAIIAGSGAGIAELGAIAGVSEVVPVRARGYANGIMLVMSIPAGPYVLYGQLLATRATWRWGFWIACIVDGLAIIGLALTYFPTKHSRMHGLSNREMLKRIDWVGGALLTIGFTLFLVACQSGGYTHAWSSAYVLCNLIVGLCTIIAFVIWEVYVPSYPMLPRELFQRRIIVIVYVIAFVAGMNYYSLTNFGPIYFSNVYSSSPVTIGIRNIGFPTATLCTAIVANMLLSKFPRHILWIIAAACALTTTAAGLFIIGNPNNPGAVVAFAVLAGIGNGGLIVPIATVAIIASPENLIATTGALTLAIRIFGGTIGYSIYYNIFVTKLTTRLPALVAEYALEAGLPSTSLTDFVSAFLTSSPSVASVPGVTTEIIKAATLGTQWAYAYSLRFVFIASIPFGILATIAAFFLHGVDQYMTDDVVAHLHG